MVAMVAHALALIENRKFGGQLNPDRIAVLALYHDATEILTGDLPTPIKYHNPAIAAEYKKIEKLAEQRLLHMLPAEFIDDFRPLLDSDQQDPRQYTLVKAADTLCAYSKCLEELAAGNHEFEVAKRRLEKMLEQRMTPTVRYFLDTFMPSFSLTLDDMSQDQEE